MSDDSYLLDRQVGFLLRRATQRHLAIFARIIPDLTPPQFATLAKLSETGALSQNALGREVAMDAATIKGVVDRLVARGLVATSRDPADRRRMQVALSPAGAETFRDLKARAHAITDETLSPLDPDSREHFLKLLARLA